jgi:hypothetical protein
VKELGYYEKIVVEESFAPGCPLRVAGKVKRPRLNSVSSGGVSALQVSRRVELC